VVSQSSDRERSERADGWQENRPSTGWLPSPDLRRIWAYRELALMLAVRDIKLRYKQALFGIAWALIQPLASVAVFTVLLGRLAGVPSEGLPYAAFAISGMVAWSYLSTAVSSAAESLTEHRDLVEKVYFPRIIAPLAATIASLLDLAVSLPVAVMVVALSASVGPSIVALPVCILALALVALGAGLWLSALNVLYRDVRYALAFLLQLWFFSSPVVFPSSLVTGPASYFYAINPMVGVLDAFRWSVAGGPAPGPQAGVSLTAAIVILVSGLVYFRRVERRMADRI
jgi:lipopolysaccharide transport system permease protein